LTTTKLSICIPTFNRRQFLDWTLQKTLADFPDAQIIISDNCSTDDTKLLMNGIRIRYIRQATNIGAFPNMRAALLAASTEYCMYLGDDDYLLPEQVQKGIDFLDANPEVNCYFAPCQLYDELKQEPAWDAFYASEDKTFTRRDDLWNFVIQRHVWPEHAIYRRKALDKIMQPRVRPYWCFVDLGNAASLGPVHFATLPYYRNLMGHPVGHRQKLGDMQCLTDFEEYRSGLECLAFDLFRNHLHDDIPREQRDALKATINTGIRQFIYMRLEVAHRILVAQNRAAEAEIFKKRMVITGF
jgi:glycosyltransferase involved in cell wall biosynthesis